MNASRTLLLSALLAAIGLTSASPAAVFVKYDGIDGEAVDEKHKEWIEVLAFSHGADPANPSADDLNAVTITKEVDASSPALQQAAATGQAFGNIDFDFTDLHPQTNERKTYYQWELKDAIVSSYSISSGADGSVIETITLGPPVAANLVENEFDAAGRKRDRRVRSFRTDPATGLHDYNFERPSVALPGGVLLQTKGTPTINALDPDSDDDGILELTDLSSSGVDGFDASTTTLEMGHNFSMRQSDPNNAAHVEGAASFDNGEQFSFGVEREMKESGEKSARLSANFDGIGSSAYDYVITNGGAVVAEGTASGLDELVSVSGTGDPADLIDEALAVSLAYGKIEWTFTSMENASVPGHSGPIYMLDPRLKTSVTLEAIDPFSSSTALTGVGFGFGNFESVVVNSVTAIPEPGAAALLLIGAGIGCARRR